MKFARVFTLAAAALLGVTISAGVAAQAKPNPNWPKTLTLGTASVGGTFFEPSGAVHTTNGSARSDGPTRAVVFMLVPKGSPLSSPA